LNKSVYNDTVICIIVGIAKENVMIKLTKKADAFWAGNGFGNEAAEWVVKGAEDIVVRKSGFGWVATENGTRIVSGRGTKKEVIAELEWKRPELAS
jgi:hypothetical protein